MTFVKFFILLSLLAAVVLSQFQWQSRDSFDDISERMKKVTGENCKMIERNNLFLPRSTVTHIPDIKYLNIDPVFPNRTNLLHLHNMAISRAFFYSYILKKAQDQDEPGFMYYYLSVLSDVAANRYINSSAIYFAPNMSFTPSYKGFFNKTLPLFAPRAFRADDYNDPFHLERISTLNTIEVADLGAVPKDSKSINYTHDQYLINEWYTKWLPDTTTRHDSKTTYTVQITHANGTNETFIWHGPPSGSDGSGPVKWSKPYFDCGRSNKWIFGATVPIPDIFPRHTGWRHIEIPTYVAVAVMEMDFDRIDINQCPLGNGNPPPNYFSGTARCKNDTTECEPIHGYGFRRGGYQCRCNPGYRLPKVVRNPYLGEVVERASYDQYKKGFSCEKIGYMGRMTHNVVRVEKIERLKYIGRVESRMGLYNMTHSRIDPRLLLKFLNTEVNRHTCHKIKAVAPERLTLRGDIAFKKESQLENEARSALRLANFISAFLQLVDSEEQFAEFRVPDRPLTSEQIIGEALAMVIGNEKILGCGVLFDRNQFPNTTYFAPYAYRLKRNTRKFFVDHLSGEKDSYLKKAWFKDLKIRWAANTEDLETFTTKMAIRFNSSGEYLIKYDHYPLYYRAASINHGVWSSPYFDCGGFHNDWILTYAAPFFGWDKIRSKLEFKGAVIVSTKLDSLDLSQCYEDYYVQNAFKDTHKCDVKSSRCVPIMGRGFRPGGYKCECNQGFEYPLNNQVTYFDGQIVEDEFEKLLEDKPSRYDTLRCRIAGAALASPLLSLVLVAMLLAAARW